MATELTKRNAERLNDLYARLRERAYTKEELCEIYGTNERQVRLMVATIAKRKPIITTSDQKGYRAAVNLSDYAEAMHSWAELSSRMEELESRIKPLIQFCDKCKQLQGEAYAQNNN